MAQNPGDDTDSQTFTRTLRSRLQDRDAQVTEADLRIDIAYALLETTANDSRPDTIAPPIERDIPVETRRDLARRSGLDPETNPIDTPIDALLAAGFGRAETVGDPLCWIRALSHHQDGEVADEIQITFVHAEGDLRMLGPADVRCWEVKRVVWDATDVPGTVRAGQMTLSEALYNARRMPRPADQDGRPCEFPDLTGRLERLPRRHYRTDIRDPDGHRIAGIVYDVPETAPTPDSATGSRGPDTLIEAGRTYVIEDRHANPQAPHASTPTTPGGPRWRLITPTGAKVSDDFGVLEDALLPSRTDRQH